MLIHVGKTTVGAVNFQAVFTLLFNQKSVNCKTIFS